MFRFLIPFSDGSVWNVTPGGTDLAEAFDLYRRYWWNVETPGAVAVYHNAALVARVLPIYNQQTDAMEPLLLEWP